MLEAGGAGLAGGGKGTAGGVGAFQTWRTPGDADCMPRLMRV